MIFIPFFIAWPIRNPPIPPENADVRMEPMSYKSSSFIHSF